MADYDVKVLEISKGGNTYTYDAGGTHYAVCDTAAGTQTKAVTISEIASLTTGLSVRIKFSNAQTYNGQPKLQINSLTAANIVRMGTTAAARYEWQAGEVLDFVYDGTNFIIQEGAVPTTTYYGSRIKLSSATNSTSEDLAATPKAVKAAYDLANGKASTSVATRSANGLMSSTDKTKLDGIATGATANVGTITGINMNGASKGTSGVVNLGTVLTSHQDISSKANRDEIGIVVTGNTASQNVTSGQYVIVRNSTISGISDGLYMASANVSAGTAFTSANLTAVSNGGLNSLNEHIVTFGLPKLSNIICLTDSYGTDDTSANRVSWCTHLRDMIGLVDEETFRKINTPGASFGDDDASKNLYDIFVSGTSSMSEAYKNTVSDIIIECGVNEWNESISIMLSKMTALDTYIRANFPNATIRLFACGWDKLANIRSALKGINNPKFGLYKTISNDLGWIFVENISAMVFKDTYIDDVHPNSDGSKMIAGIMYNAINGNNIQFNTDVIKRVQIITSSTTRILGYIYYDGVKYTIQPTTVTCDAIPNIPSGFTGVCKLGKIVTDAIIGCDYANTTSVAYFPCILGVKVNGTWNQINGNAYFAMENGETYLYFRNNGDAGKIPTPGYSNITDSYISIGQINIPVWD